MKADSATLELSQAIENRARELGFDRIGFAPAKPPAQK